MAELGTACGGMGEGEMKPRNRSIIHLYETTYWPFTAWAQDYLQNGGSKVSRLGMSVHEAIKLELLDRDATIAKQAAEIRALRQQVKELASLETHITPWPHKIMPEGCVYTRPSSERWAVEWGQPNEQE